MRIRWHAAKRRVASWQIVAIPALLLSISALTAIPVSAHARLLSSTPASGSALATMPAEIQLAFSEEIDSSYSAATLLTVLDEPVPLGALSVSDADRVMHISVADQGSVSPGTYVLVWRVLSAADGHVTTGTVTFSAGTGVAPDVGSASAQLRPPWWRIALKWGEITGLVVLLGDFFFALAVARSSDVWRVPGVRRLVGAVSALLMVCVLLAGYDLGLNAAGRSVLQPPALVTYRDLILHSSAGRSWLAILLLGIVMILIANRRPESKRLCVVGLVAGFAALLSLSIGGHAAATSHSARSIAINWVHVSAVACWFGALPYLWLTTRSSGTAPIAQRLSITAETIGRFSRFGLAFMAAIVATGFLRAADQVDGARSLAGTDYGRVLIAKHLLLVPVLGAAAANLLVLVPRLRAAKKVNVPSAMASAVTSVRHFVSAELAGAILILLAAATLTELAPANGPLAVDVAAKLVTIDQRAEAGDLSIWVLGRLTGAPNDRYTITITDANGDLPADTQRVIIESSIPVNGESVGDRFDAQPLTGSGGTYFFPALRLGLKGPWNVEVLVRRAGVEDVASAFAIDTTDAGTQPPRLVADDWRLPRVPIDAWLLFGCAAVVFVGGLVAVRRLPGVEPFAVAIIMTMIALITAGFAVQGYRRAIPVSAGSDLVNPISADAGSVQRGSHLYASQCLQCHGAGAVGIDKSDPEHQHATGTNLVDGVSSKQRDGDLFWAISNGVGGTDMPAFDAALSENDRWDLVNYLRSLQEVRGEPE